MKYPFEADYQEILADPDSFVTAVFSTLESEFLLLPRGNGFIEYPQFEAGYQALKKVTGNFAELPRQKLLDLVTTTPISLIVIRSILGFTPPEWAYVTSQRKRLEVQQGFARTLDLRIRKQPLCPLRSGDASRQRLTALLDVACDLIEEGCPTVNAQTIHRLQSTLNASSLISSCRSWMRDCNT